MYTIGHSNHPLERFIELLAAHGITAVADVRSRPFSRRHPQFNKDALATELQARGIAYIFTGSELGARPDDSSCYLDGRVSYERVANSGRFRTGIDRVLDLAGKHRLALMCAEREPLDCHRTILVSRALDARGAAIKHILADGRIETHEDAMTRLIELARLPSQDLFRSRAELVDLACAARERKIAYSRGAVGQAGS